MVPWGLSLNYVGECCVRHIVRVCTEGLLDDSQPVNLLVA